MRAIACFFALLWLTVAQAEGVTQPRRWVHGAPGEPTLQVHAAAPGLWILRQSKASNFEAPFIYLIAGKDRALLLDSGAEPAAGTTLPLRKTVDELLTEWARSQGTPSPALTVAHTHSHRDHTYGDAVFRDRPDTRIVGTQPHDVAAFFKLDRWPDGEAVFDLGERELTILPLPGHEPAHIAVYDACTRSLLSGDTLYPGLLTIRDWPAYRASAQRLQAFAQRHRVDRILGAHIEMSADAGRMYPLGSAVQPNEHALPLAPAQLALWAARTRDLGDFLGEDVQNDFILGRVSPASNDPPQTHGMLVAGTDVVYFSHLPMFHVPHNYQLILEAQLPEDVLAEYRADAARHPDTYYTVAPTQRWVLPNTVREGAQFQVDLYRGHFERDGTPIRRDVTATVKRIVHFRRFEPGTKPAPERWIAFGRGREHFLAHRIEGAPDMDQIVVSSLARTENESVTLPGVRELKTGDRVAKDRIQRVLYTEYGDLAK